MYDWKSFALVFGWCKCMFLPKIMILGIGSNVFHLETAWTCGPRFVAVVCS